MFSGLCRGITRSTFQMFGIFAVFTESFLVSVRYLSAIGPRCCNWFGAILSGPSALLLFVYLIASVTVLHWNILPSVSSFLIVLSVFLFFIFLGVWSILLMNILAHFLGSWVVFLASNYMAVCRWFRVTWRKFFYSALEFWAVTSVNECLYKLDLLFALLTLKNFVYFKV